ncbi:hypothetical protein J437_LFUL012410 [Ladona fulva]|uniref:Uncharacterized protein n=1 Tax=Ladona fulva TaxID=123851 RepID=A0A8K0KPP8_LADFU|nr:hypothetical protein J437_LFUL012410 [Ladona fulva]
MYFMQDGAPPHHFSDVRDFLNLPFQRAVCFDLKNQSLQQLCNVIFIHIMVKIRPVGLLFMSGISVLLKLNVSDEATFHLSGKVNKHNCRIWGSENPLECLEHVRDIPKLNMFCALGKSKVYDPFFFQESTSNGKVYLDMMENLNPPD